jgi:hypothetical protein
MVVLLYSYDWDLLAYYVEYMDCLSFNIMLCVTAVFPSALCNGVVVPGGVGILNKNLLIEGNAPCVKNHRFSNGFCVSFL